MPKILSKAINYATTNNPVRFGEVINQALAQKVLDRLQDKYIEVASGLLKGDDESNPDGEDVQEAPTDLDARAQGEKNFVKMHKIQRHNHPVAEPSQFNPNPKKAKNRADQENGDTDGIKDDPDSNTEKLKKQTVVSPGIGMYSEEAEDLHELSPELLRRYSDKNRVSLARSAFNINKPRGSHGPIHRAKAAWKYFKTGKAPEKEEDTPEQSARKVKNRLAGGAQAERRLASKTYGREGKYAGKHYYWLTKKRDYQKRINKAGQGYDKAPDEGDEEEAGGQRIAASYERHGNPIHESADVLNRWMHLRRASKSSFFYPKHGAMYTESDAHPGFAKVSSKIASQKGISQKRADAILAASTRRASAKAKRANPRLKRVKG